MTAAAAPRVSVSAKGSRSTREPTHRFRLPTLGLRPRLTSARCSSLSALGNVIAALASHRSHIPYRDSKLTSLLKETLGGNAHTLMLGCVSPADRYYAENVSTLRYAARAQRISNQPVLNEDPKTRVIRRLRAEIGLLRRQLALFAVGKAVAEQFGECLQFGMEAGQFRVIGLQ